MGLTAEHLHAFCDVNFEIYLIPDVMHLQLNQ